MKHDYNRIKLLASDFDGVFTDNRVLVREDGTESVICNRSDGLGLEMVRAVGIKVVVISKEQNPVVTARCKKLKIPVIQGVGDKLPILKDYMERSGVSREEIMFIGNDTNDIECIKFAGIGVCVADSHQDVLKISDIVTQRKGGYGALREICDQLLKTRDKNLI